MEPKACCFTGHRNLPQNAIEHLMLRLNSEVEGLIRQGVTHFLSGGERGFDLIAAALVVSKKEMAADLQLDFILPYRNQNALWPEREKKLYRSLLAEADSVKHLSDAYQPGCIKRCDRYLVEHADYCIYAILHDRSDKWQTMQYARQRGLSLISVTKG